MAQDEGSVHESGIRMTRSVARRWIFMLAVGSAVLGCPVPASAEFVALALPATARTPSDETALAGRSFLQEPFPAAESDELLPEPQPPATEPQTTDRDLTGGSMTSPSPRPSTASSPTGTLADEVRLEAPPCVGVCRLLHTLDVMAVHFPIFHPPCA